MDIYKLKLKRGLTIPAAVIFVLVLYWFTLPPINPVSPDFWVFVFLSFAAFTAAILLPSGLGQFSQTVVHKKSENGNEIIGLNLPKQKSIRIITLVVLGGFALAIVLYIAGIPLFNASRYKDLIVRQPGDFSQDVAELSMTQIPVVDHDTASHLGRRKLGEIADLVSQFEISNDYTQINFRGRPVRVTPLVYGDFFKWFNNRNEGISHYITVDMVTQQADLVSMEQGIKYSPSELFLRNLNRHLRFGNPTKMFDAISFEIDDDSTPYWVAPTYRYRIAVWGGRDIDGAVLVNAITGEQKWYPVEEIPEWVDRVYRSQLVIQQLNYNGKFQEGFFNSIIGQRGVLQPTSGYNYIAVNDDVYLYTGMTSMTGDQSNVGFVLINMRTKDTKFYSIPGAEEVSAMSSAQGQVQHLGYRSTFPLLLNIAERPTYFMSLKDNAGLVKMYAFVDVNRYQLVGVGESVAEARINYGRVLTREEDVGIGEDIQGVVQQISSAVVEGNTLYYILLEDSDIVYTASLKITNRLPFLQAGDEITLTYTGDQETREVMAVQLN